MKFSVTHNEQKASTSLQLLLEKMMLTMVSLVLFTSFAQAQNITVKGRVTNETGSPIPDASVTVKGTSVGATSNGDGYYQIAVPARGTIVFSSVGYTARDVAVAGRTSINISLTSAANNLDQVVVVGYGTQRKKDVTGSVVSVTASTLKEFLPPIWLIS